MVFARLTPADKDAFFALLDEYFASRPDLFGSGAWDYSTNREEVYEFWREGAERARGLESVYTIGMRGAGERRGSIFDG